MAARFISYFRVSTAQQGRSGLGLEAQQEAVAGYLRAHDGVADGQFTEIESGKRADRPQLAAALARCRLTGATLVVAKLDRLARDVRFLLDVLHGVGGGGVVFCDLPAIPPGPAGRFLLQQMAAVAELEAGLISQRTKAALAAAKARGTVLGGWRGGPTPDAGMRAAGLAERRRRGAEFTARVLPEVQPLREAGMSLREICIVLEARGIRTPRGGAWVPAAVSKILAAA